MKRWISFKGCCLALSKYMAVSVSLEVNTKPLQEFSRRLWWIGVAKQASAGLSASSKLGEPLCSPEHSGYGV